MASPMRICFAVMLAWALANPAAADEPFAQPRPGLHTGGVPTPEQLRGFAARGVGTVIDLRAPGERGDDDTVQATARALGLSYVNLPVAGAADLTEAKAEALRHALDNADGDVLLHCASGNRVGALLALMAFHEEGLSRREALALGRAAGLKGLEPDVDRHLRTARRTR